MLLKNKWGLCAMMTALMLSYHAYADEAKTQHTIKKNHHRKYNNNRTGKVKYNRSASKNSDYPLDMFVGGNVLGTMSLANDVTFTSMWHAVPQTGNTSVNDYYTLDGMIVRADRSYGAGGGFMFGAMFSDVVIIEAEAGYLVNTYQKGKNSSAKTEPITETIVLDGSEDAGYALRVGMISSIINANNNATGELPDTLTPTVGTDTALKSTLVSGWDAYNFEDAKIINYHVPYALANISIRLMGGDKLTPYISLGAGMGRFKSELSDELGATGTIIQRITNDAPSLAIGTPGIATGVGETADTTTTTAAAGTGTGTPAAPTDGIWRQADLEEAVPVNISEFPQFGTKFTDKKAPLYQLGFGVLFASDPVDISVGYRFMSTLSKLELDDDLDSDNVSTLNTKFARHSAILSVRYIISSNR